MKLQNIKTWFKNHIEFGKYETQFQLGISATIHGHDSDTDKHFHFWIDLGFWYIEISINDKRYE